jgi:hypothetical protein
MSRSNPLLEAALDYARRGWPVFPCHTITKDGRCSCGKDCGRSAGKHPRTEHGLKDATTSEKIIRAWWRTWPDANIAMATGEKAPEVLDCDLKEHVSGLEMLADLQLRHGPLPETLAQVTGGGGRQYFFKPSGKIPNKVAFALGLDTRGAGGYVIIPPSIHKSGKRYQWVNGITDLADWPEWLLAEILKGQPQGESRRAEGKDSEETDRIMECAFLQHCDRDRATLSEIQWYAMISNLCRAQGGPAKVHELSRGYPEYNPAETDKKILHALNDTGPHTCQYIKGMWDCSKTCGVKAPAALAHRGKVKEGRILEPPTGWTAAELMAQDFPEPRWILPGILPEGMALLAGRPKVGKSWQALQVALAVAFGGRALGTIIPEQGRVIYLALEDSPRRLRKRLGVLRGGSLSPDNLHLFPKWPRVDSGGLLHLDAFLKNIPIRG